MKKRWRPKIPQSLTAAADKAILPIDITKISTYPIFMIQCFVELYKRDQTGRSYS